MQNLGVHWKDWCWSWHSNTLATSCEELTHWKRPWCWEVLRAGEEGDDRGWDGWMASPTRWTWVWMNSGSWWWTGRPGVLWFMGLQRIRHNWATELNWTELNVKLVLFIFRTWEACQKRESRRIRIAYSNYRSKVKNDISIAEVNLTFVGQHLYSSPKKLELQKLYNGITL